MGLAEMQSLVELLERSAEAHRDEPALAMAGGGPATTYGELFAQSGRGAAELARRGMVPGDAALVLVESSPDWAASFFAILGAGLVAVPLTPDTPPESVAAVARASGARAAILGKRAGERIAGAGLRGAIRAGELFSAHSRDLAFVARRRDDLALLAFTSGSTARPRAVELTHGNLLADAGALLSVRSGGPGDALLSMLPPAHLFELMGGLLCPLACGARVVYAPSFMPNRIIEALRERRITHALAVPALVACLYEEARNELVARGFAQAGQTREGMKDAAERLRADPIEERWQDILRAVREQIGPAFRSLIVGGAAVDPLMVEVIAALGVEVEVGYGLTEAGPIVSVGQVGEAPAGSVGRTLPGVEARIDPTGEILVRGPNVMRGYFGDPEATSAAFAEGWLRTGDRGRVDEAGFLFITGRVKEAMVTATGETIYPDEIEPYYRDPLFAEGCVAPLPGADGNDRPALVVVAAAGAEDAELNDAYSRCRAAAPMRCRVDGMICVDGPLPRTATGKVRRRALAEDLAKRMAPQ